MPQKNKSFLLLAVVVLVVVAISVLMRKPTEKPVSVANQMQTQSYDKVTYKVGSLRPANSPAHFGTIEFTNGKPVSANMAKAILCADHVGDIAKVDLYMPDMGHGSQPPVVAKALTIPTQLQEQAAQDKSFGCLTVESMQLFMAGLWQVRAFYNDGTVGIFDVSLEK